MVVAIADRKPLNVVKYVAKDFPSFFDSILRRLKTEYGDTYNDFVTTDTGIMLIDLMAYSLSQLAWYLDRRASDCYLDSSRTREAVERIVRQIAYKMKSSSTSSTSLKLTFGSGIPGNGVMTAGFKFAGPSSLIFESISDLVLTASGGSVVYNVDVRQGVTRTLTYSSDGTANQSYSLASVPEGKYLAEGSIKAFVDGLEWTEEDFIEFEKTNQYEILYNDVPPVIRFGDGVAGNIPSNNAEIKIQFLVIDGKDGNVKSETITAAIDTLKVAGQDVDFTVINEDGTDGGTEPETIEKAKKLAPFSFAARGAAITQADYFALASAFSDSQYGAVAKAFAHTLRSSGSDEYFNSLVDVVKQTVATYLSSIVSAQAAADASVLAVSSEITDGNTAVTGLDDIRTTILVPQIGVASAAAETVNASASAIIGDLSTMTSVLASMDAVINTVTDPAGAKTDLQGYSGELASLRGSANTSASGISAQAGSVIGAAKLLSDAVTGSGDTIQGHSGDLTTVFTNIASEHAIIVSNVGTISTASATLQSDIDTAMGNIETYFDALFDHDCKSNVVQIPILTQGSDETYRSPSSGLIKALQVYFDGIKEVTQVVRVIDGISSLVYVDVAIGVKVLPNYLASEVKSQIDSVVTTKLIGRDFDDPLYVSALNDEILENVTGYKYVDITITNTGSVSYIDANGNCVPPNQKIIEKNSVTVTEIS